MKALGGKLKGPTEKGTVTFYGLLKWANRFASTHISPWPGGEP